MRFPKETRALVYGAGPNAVMISWPSGAPEPQKGRVYWMQSEEDAKEAKAKAQARREYSPETHADVMAAMYKRVYDKEPKRKKKRRRRSTTRPKKGDPQLLVIDTTILDVGWEAKVALYEDPDPVNHLRVKAKVPGGPNPIDGFQEATELEPEQIITRRTRHQRLEAEEAMKLEHRASIDMSEVMKAERRVADQRKKGKPGKIAAAAVERARKRAVLVSADGYV